MRLVMGVERPNQSVLFSTSLWLSSEAGSGRGTCWLMSGWVQEGQEKDRTRDHSGGRMGRTGESPVCEEPLLCFSFGVVPTVFMGESRWPDGHEEGEMERVVFRVIEGCSR